MPSTRKASSKFAAQLFLSKVADRSRRRSNVPRGYAAISHVRMSFGRCRVFAIADGKEELARGSENEFWDLLNYIKLKTVSACRASCLTGDVISSTAATLIRSFVCGSQDGHRKGRLD